MLMKRSKLLTIPRVATRMLLATLLLTMTAQTAGATETSTITVGGTDYTLFTGFTATAGTAGTFGYANFVDGNTSTKWRVMKNIGSNTQDFAGGTEDPAYVEFHADAPFIPKGYILTYDNSENESWKPTSWALKAKLNESDNWTTIHSSNSSLGNGSRFEIACNNDGDNMYQYFRFEIYDVGTTYQSILNELEFYGNTGFIHLTPKDATCTETGIKQECWYSNGKYFSDANGTTELQESAVVEPMIPHSGTHHEASATNTEYWQCSVCGKYFSDSGCTNEISEAEALIGVFGAIADGRYTLTSQTYTLTDDINTAGYIYVPAGVTATIDLNGHTIDRGLTSAMTNGSVIIVEGMLTIIDASTGGKVQGGYDAGDGYGYYTSCVKVLVGATFNLQGGTLIGRDQDYDYTVSVVENSYFTMAGGKITGGWNGVLAEGNVTLTGGEISGNNMGVRVGENFSISGNPVITNNTRANVMIYSWLVINVVGALTDGANIGISAPTPTNNAPVTVTSGYGTYNSVSPDTYFSLDNDGQIQTSPFDYMTVVMGWNEDRTEIAVGTATRTVTFDMNGHGDAINAVSLLSGYKVAEPTAPTADGWYFVSWFTDAECTADNEYDFENAVTSDLTLHAKWTQTAIHSINLPENMVIVSTDKEAVGGKYPVGTVIKFKLSSADYVVEGDVKNGEEVLSADANGIYTVTMGDADLTITATVKKAVEPNKTLSGSDNYTAQDGDVLTGSTSGTVTIADNAKITLSDVTITGGIVCEGTADITLVGTNSVSGATNKAGIQVGGSSTTLTIKGNGSLTANGGSQSAGIGLSRAWDVDAMGGNIVIEGGNITATGGSMGAGIGLGVAYDNSPRTITLGNITIKGGSVTATGGNQGKGIGTGYVYGLQNASNIGVGTITITTGIDRVEASSISESVTYKHGDTDVTSNASDYFAINGTTITLREYTITYNLNDGTNATGNPATYNLKTETFTLADPSKTGYVFAGWFSDAEFNTATTTTIAQGSTGDKTFWAKWTKLMTNTGITVSIPSQEWTGNALTPVITVTDGTTTLNETTDYTVTAPSGPIQNANDYTYTITGAGNYSGETTATFTITPKPVTVKANDMTKVIGEADPTLTATVTGLVDGYDITYDLSRETGEEAGTYIITPSGATAQGNYTVTYLTGTMTIAMPTQVSIALTEEYGTYCSDYDLDFSGATGLTAYIAAGYNKTEHTLLMVKVTSVPKGTGLLLKSTSATGGNFTATVKPSPYVYSNLLTGTTAGTNVTADDFILGKKGDKVGFYHAEAGTLAAGKAYLDHTKLGTSTSGARMLNLEFYDDATAIRANIREIAGGDQWYTLDGRKLQSKPTLKGLYILNGKKTVVR